MDPSSAIWDATKCLCGYVKKKAAYVSDLEDNLKLLKEKGEKLEEKKKDVEALVEEQERTREMQRMNQVSDWLKRVEQIQKEIRKIHQVHEDIQIQNKCLSKCCPSNCISSYKLGKGVAKILTNVHELDTEGGRYCGDFTASKHQSKSNEMPCGETVGLNAMFDEVRKSIEEKDVGIIGLYGMGGVGKTTLLKKIHNELGKISGVYIIWAVVSKSPNLDSVMDCIRKVVGIVDDIWRNCSNQDEKASKIYRVLKEKKFVLLLDDIWESFELVKVGVPQPKETNFQSKVLLTTRNKDVCDRMDAERTFKVEILSQKEALELFCMRVGDKTLKSHPFIPKIAEEMAKECQGLPLALTVVGSAMAGVKSVDEWENSKNDLKNSSWIASSLEANVYSVLKFSYDRLPSETHKKCFLYCALYPEDDEILVVDIIYKWIGEGFLYHDRMRSVHDMQSRGRSIIEKLKYSCMMIEMVEDDSFFLGSFKMHDVIRDMALWIARDQDENKEKIIVQEDAQRMCEANFEEWEMVERISIMKGAGSLVQGIAWTNLKTLLLRFDRDDITIDGLQNIQYARRLKVLELEGVQNVPLKEIGGLNLLEYLSLERFKSKDASDISRELKNLKNLKVFHLNCDAIPLGLISNLQQLKVCRLFPLIIDNPDDKREKEFLKEVECSSNLEELWVNIKTKSGLDKLFKSTKSQSCMYCLHLSDVDAPINGPLLLSAMSNMKNLHIILFNELQNVIDPSVDDTCRLSTLRTVSIEDCGTIHHLTWLKYARYLEELVVSRCSSIEEVIKGEILEDEKDAIFPSLVVLQLSGLPNLRSICERVLSFPSLRSIDVWNCENLKKLPFDSNSGKANLKHIRGDHEWWDNLEWDDPATKATFLPKF